MSVFIIIGYICHIIINGYYKSHLVGKLKDLLELLAKKSENKGVIITLELRDMLHCDSGLGRDK